MRQAAGWPAAGAAVAVSAVLLLLLGGPGAAAAARPGTPAAAAATASATASGTASPTASATQLRPGSAHGYGARRAAPAGDARLPADLPGAAAAVPGLPAAAGRARTA